MTKDESQVTLRLRLIRGGCFVCGHLSPLHAPDCGERFAMCSNWLARAAFHERIRSGERSGAPLDSITLCEGYTDDEG